jgi:hypothetical protein
VPTAIRLDPEGSTAISHVIGAIPVPEWLTDVASISIDGDFIIVAAKAGETISLPFAAAFLFGEN